MRKWQPWQGGLIKGYMEDIIIFWHNRNSRRTKHIIAPNSNEMKIILLYKKHADYRFCPQ